MGDLAGAVEMGEGWGVEEGRGKAVIDWRRAYYVLSKVMFRIKSLVVRAGEDLWCPLRTLHVQKLACWIFSLHCTSECSYGAGGQ